MSEEEYTYCFTVETTGMRVEEYQQTQFKYSIEPSGVLLIIKKADPANGEPEKLKDAYGPGGWLVLKNRRKLVGENEYVSI